MFKKVWAKVLGFSALLFGAVLGGWALSRYHNAVGSHATVKSPTPFVPCPYNKTRVQVWAGKDAGFKSVQLPDGVLAKDVKAVEYSAERGSAKVEVKVAKSVDRRAVARG